MTDPQNPAGPEGTQPSEPAVTPPPAPEAAPAAPAYDAPAAPAAPAPEAAPAALAYDAPAAPAAPAYGAPAAPAYGTADATQPPAYAAAPPAYGAPAPTATEPGKTLGIVALVVVFFASIVGLILGYVARSQSKNAGVQNTPAKVAIILGWIFTALAIIGTIIAIVVIIAAGTAVYSQLCEGMPSGTYELTNGDTITCP